MSSRRKAPEVFEAVQDRLCWKRHVERQRKMSQNNPDLFYSLEGAKRGAKELLSDFEKEPEDSVVTIFSFENGNYKIDAISNHSEFELHRDEYEPEDVVALVFFRKGEPFVKSMK